ncbi:DUF4376 domain-containing protein [Pseudomonas atacamensis]|uniref:DUF4376 domain-containing protein n=1 Tax=Pseudomonas atacamensis TaxID=2565368 RepID=A0AAQ2D700_9PSED|nr:DUF4376 domain-containing protein [Pseudomonas atacamensis]THF26512.1 DUF4376 domain-containing protein [Pseudomonas atacamensis]
MKIFVSPTVDGFFHQPGNNNIPEDAVQITTDQYAILLRGLSEGKSIVWGGEGVPVLVEPEPAAKDYKRVVAQERFAREATGVSVDGLQIETTRDSQALIASTGLSAVLDPEYRCNFKTVGGFVEIGAAQIIAIAKAVRAHVQACFDRELTLLRAIEAGEYHEDMLSQGWPDSTPPDPAELQ